MPTASARHHRSRSRFGRRSSGGRRSSDHEPDQLLRIGSIQQARDRQNHRPQLEEFSRSPGRATGYEFQPGTVTPSKSAKTQNFQTYIEAAHQSMTAAMTSRRFPAPGGNRGSRYRMSKRIARKAVRRD